MDAAETERELEELESRIERLRALYEQYFIGIEKLEPAIQRKDVDRRIWVLRREQIRNTGLRFRFQMLIQRYSTFQQYWQRVSREIEAGTYRRDVIRAAKRIGEKEAMTIVGRKRAAQYARLIDAQQDRRSRRGRPESTEEPADPAFARASIADDSELVAQAEGAGAPVSAVLAPASDCAEPLPRPAPPDPEAAKRRVAMLAAQMRAERASSADLVPDEPLSLELDLDTERRSGGDAERRSGGDAERRSGGEAPRNARPPPPRQVAPPPPRPLPAPPPARRSSAPPKPDIRPSPLPPDPSGLTDQRIRQIYSRYIDTKRASNESTAGITYDKLAQSLRAQAVKLRASHTGKSVDYEVIVKDGRTILKPIVR